MSIAFDIFFVLIKGRYILKMKYLEKCLSLRSPVDNERLVDFSVTLTKYNDTDYLISATAYVPKNIKLTKVSNFY